MQSEDIISSEEMVAPAERIQAPERPPELEITDQDVERALKEAPRALVDSITLREEVPRRTLDVDEVITLMNFVEHYHYKYSQKRYQTRKISCEY